jgi:hypothetical protein
MTSVADREPLETLNEWIFMACDAGHAAEGTERLTAFVADFTCLAPLYAFILADPPLQNSHLGRPFIQPAVRLHWANLSAQDQNHYLQQQLGIFLRETALPDMRNAFSVIRMMLRWDLPEDLTPLFDQLAVSAPGHSLLLAGCRFLPPISFDSLWPFLAGFIPSLVQDMSPQMDFALAHSASYFLAKALMALGRSAPDFLAEDLWPWLDLAQQNLPAAVHGRGPDIFWRELFSLAFRCRSQRPEMAHTLLARAVQLCETGDVAFEARWAPLWGFATSTLATQGIGEYRVSLLQREMSLVYEEVRRPDGSFVTPRSGLVGVFAHSTTPDELFALVLENCVRPTLDADNPASVQVGCDYLASVIFDARGAIPQNLEEILSVVRSVLELFTASEDIRFFEGFVNVLESLIMVDENRDAYIPAFAGPVNQFAQMPALSGQAAPLLGRMLQSLNFATLREIVWDNRVWWTQHFPEEFMIAMVDLVHHSPVVPDEDIEELWAFLARNLDSFRALELLGEVLARNEFALASRLDAIRGTIEEILAGAVNGEEWCAPGLLSIWENIRSCPGVDAFFVDFVARAILALFQNEKAYFHTANQCLSVMIKDFPRTAPEIFGEYVGFIMECIRRVISGPAAPGAFLIAGRLARALPPEFLDELFQEGWRQIDVESPHLQFVDMVLRCFLLRAVRAHERLIAPAAEFASALVSGWIARFPENLELHMTVINFQIAIIPMTHEIPESFLALTADNGPQGARITGSELLLCYRPMIDKKVLQAGQIEVILTVIREMIGADSTTPVLWAHICAILGAMIVAGYESATAFVREAAEVLAGLLESDPLARTMAAEMFVHAAARGVVNLEVSTAALRLLAFPRRARAVGIVLSSLLEMATQHADLWDHIAAALIRCLPFLHSRLEIPGIDPRVLEGMETFFLAFVGQYGMNQLQQLLPECWDREDAIGRRVQLVLERAQARANPL